MSLTQDYLPDKVYCNFGTWEWCFHILLKHGREGKGCREIIFLECWNAMQKQNIRQSTQHTLSHLGVSIIEIYFKIESWISILAPTDFSSSLL